MLTEMSTAELLAVCLHDGSPEAWKEFVCRIQSVVAASVGRIVRQYGLESAEQIEDLTQEVYVRLCESRCRILRDFKSETPEALFSFLKVVSGNLARDRCRASLSLKAGDGKVIAMPERAEQLPPVLASARSGAEWIVFIREIDGILGRVPSDSLARDRAIFWLYFRQGWTSRDIAAIKSLGLTQKGVESLLQRLTRFVRAALVADPDTKGISASTSFSRRD